MLLRLGRGLTIEVQLSRASLEPGVFGIVRPVLVWPERISERLDDEQLEVILAHEVGHVRRRDNLTAALHMLVEAVFWFHPLVWWLGARLVEERERACDEQVLELGGERQVYAAGILKVCELCVESPLACLSGATGADLKRRIVRIMSGHVTHNLGIGRKLLLAAAALFAIAAPILAGSNVRTCHKTQKTTACQRRH
jgi:beta-lactamase regulating signal transducer with metallopeptidase domain